MTTPPPEKGLRLDNPLVVQWEYASEERLAQRNLAYRQLIEGDNAEDVAFEAVREVAPARVLDVGCGTGEFAERIQTDLGASVCGVDMSPRMVALTRANLVDLWTLLGDTSAREFSFDERNGEEILRRAFPHVERRDANGTIVFPSRDAMRQFVAVTITHAHLADRVPELTEPFRARTTHVVFVAEKA